MIAKILVDVQAKAVDKLFDYLVPIELESVLEIGARVIVPFGSREVMGFCIEITDESSTDRELKSLINILDLEPYITKELIDLAKRLSIDTTTVLIRVLETMLPSALKAVYKTKLIVINETEIPDDLIARMNSQNEIEFDKSLLPQARLIKTLIRKKLYPSDL